MLVISVEFLHGTYRATGSEDLALTGSGDDSGEWPPSPARLFSAFVAADGTRDRCRVTDGSELRILESAGPPDIVADEPPDVLKSQLRSRFVPLDDLYTAKDGQTSAVQEYVGRTGAEVRPGTRMSPRLPAVWYIWNSADPSSAEMEALARRAARIGYLGCADSPVRVTVGGEPPQDHPRWFPTPEGEAVLPVPAPGWTDSLDLWFDRWADGNPVRRSWISSEMESYGYMGPSPEAQRPTVLWLVLERSVPGRKVIAVTETLRAATLERYEQLFGPVPPVLSGHGFSGRGFQHSHWLALPDVGGPYSRGQIHGAAVWLPPDTPPDVVEGVRTALWHIRVLTRPGWFETGISPWSGSLRPWAVHPQRWTRRSRRWISAFPVVHERWEPGGPSLAEVGRWSTHAGVVSEPVRFRTSRSPLVTGAVSLSAAEARRPGRRGMPFTHLDIEFADPVPGPLVLGGMRQFGLGLMAPVSTRENDA